MIAIHAAAIHRQIEADALIRFNVPFSNARHFGRTFPVGFEDHGLAKGPWFERVRTFFRERHHSAEAVPTPSCTNALEMSALLLGLGPGDEVIMPAYTYVSTANAFCLHGAQPVFCDSSADSPNMDIDLVEGLITARTRAIVVVHYGGRSVDMHRLRRIADLHGLPLIEDAAHGIGSAWDGQPLGSFGDLSTKSFHETKNVSCGQGGVLLVKNPALVERALILRECGTDRHAFNLGLRDRYSWVDIGSVFSLSEMNCAYLWPQLEHIDLINARRVMLWDRYASALAPLAQAGAFELPTRHPEQGHNGHIFHIVLPSRERREALRAHLAGNNIQATFHYDGLHRSPHQLRNGEPPSLPNAERFGNCLLRLPLYYDLHEGDVDRVAETVHRFFERRTA